MKNNVLFFWVFLMLFALPACQESDAGQEADAETTEAADNEARAQAAREKLGSEPLLENGVAERVQAIIEQGGEVYGKTAAFEYLEFEPGKSVVDRNDPNRREIEELAMVLNANPRMNIEIVTYADHSGAQENPVSLARMRALFIKSTLLENGAEPQLISLKPTAADQEGDGSNAENNRVVVRLLGE